MNLEKALATAYPELAEIAAAAGERPAYLVGGAVRDLLLGRGRADIDVVVVGDAAAMATELGADTVAHERFATAKARRDGHEIDIAMARVEAYAHPGALPDVEPATSIEADLARRDFTVNAMALPLHGAVELIDPHGGEDDLRAGLLRVLHPASFVDDPSRALRAARYAARFGFELEEETAARLRQADLETISEDRRRAELLRIAAEPEAARAFELLAEWGLVRLSGGGTRLASRVAELLARPPWQGIAPRDRAVLAAAVNALDGAEELAQARVERPSEGVELARGRDPVELVLARALGADWLDRYLAEWAGVRLEIDGGDLIAAGLSEGPALGRGLDEALRRKLDGEISGREEELEVALGAAREPNE